MAVAARANGGSHNGAGGSQGHEEEDRLTKWRRREVADRGECQKFIDAQQIFYK